MRTKLFRQALSATALAFIVIVVGKYVIIAQTPITGEWTAETRTDSKIKQGDDDNNWGVDTKQGPRVQLNFSRTTARGGHNQNGSSYLYSELQGLTEQQAQNGRVSFSLVREAGTIACEGTFMNGRGSGTFTFTPNRSFFDAMKARGFDFEKSDSKHGGEPVEERMFAAATVNVTTALADDLLSANFGKLDADDLFKAAIFKVDGKFMAEMKNTGFNLGMEDLVKARIFKVDADYVRQVAQMGFNDRNFEELVKFRIFKVTPEYLNELKAAGFSKLGAEEVVKYRIFNVTPQFLNELKAAGLQDLDPEEVVKARIFNINPDFVRQQKAADPNVTMEDLVRMKIGVGKIKDKTWN
jgi:hypothetical protein